MTKDEIWEELKRDETKIYGQILFDVFVQTTDDLTLKHFMELDKELRNKINSGSVYSILIKSIKEGVDVFQKVLDELEQENIDKLTGHNVYKLFSVFLGMHTGINLDLLGELPDIIGKSLGHNINKLDHNEIWSLLSASRHTNRSIEKMSDILGRENINKLTSGEIFHILNHSSLNAESRKIRADILGPKLIERLDNNHIIEFLLSGDKDKADILGENINRLSGYDIYKLLKNSGKEWTTSQAISRKENIINILGPKNMNKLREKYKKELGLVRTDPKLLRGGL